MFVLSEMMVQIHILKLILAKRRKTERNDENHTHQARNAAGRRKRNGSFPHEVSVKTLTPSLKPTQAVQLPVH
jgi:hypothetical protein